MRDRVVLPQGTIHYSDTGSGPTIVFVHGLLVNGTLWRKVVPRLEANFRCVAPDWPLGSHPAAMATDADLSPLGLAQIVADFLAALDLDDVTLLGNDTGGAICQIVVTEYPERIGRLILTPCDAYENFLPPMFRALQLAARVPALLNASLHALRVRRLRRLPIAYGWLSKRPVDPEVTTAWIHPFLSDRGVRHDTVKVLRGISPRYTLAAAAKLDRFDGRALIISAPEDRFFPVEHAKRLAGALRDARVEEIYDSYTFVSEDQPARLAELIEEWGL